MAIEIPCVDIKVAEPLTVSLPFGGKLQSMINAADGPPNDCTVAHSLIIQVMPMMASMTCLLNVLKVISALKDAVSSVPPDFAGLISAIDDMLDCLGIVLGPIPICSMVKDILKLIIAYLNCLIDALQSILDFQVGIDLNSAQGNPVLLFQLECAQKNADATMNGMMSSMQGLAPLFELINTALSIVGQDPIGVPDMSAATPSLSDLADGKDPLEPMKTIVITLETIADALPC